MYRKPEISPSHPLLRPPVTTGDHLSVGVRPIVLLDGGTDRGAAIGEGSVMTRDAELYAIVAGAPAKPVGKCPDDIAHQLKCRLVQG